MTKESITKKMANLATAFALTCVFLACLWFGHSGTVSASTRTKESITTVFYQNFYESPYAVRLSWTEKATNQDCIAVKLSNNANVNVYFTNDSKKGMKDNNLIAAVTKELERQAADKSSMLNHPYIVTIEAYKDLGIKSIEDTIKKSYKDKELWLFDALYPQLSDTLKNDYAKKAYKDNRVDFFAIASNAFTSADVQNFTKKAYKDGKTEIFAILKNYFTSKEVQTYLKKALKDQSTSIIALLSDQLNKKEVKSFLDQAYKEGYWDVFGIFKDQLSLTDLFKYIQKAAKDGVDELSKILK